MDYIFIILVKKTDNIVMFLYILEPISAFYLAKIP